MKARAAILMMTTLAASACASSNAGVRYPAEVTKADIDQVIASGKVQIPSGVDTACVSREALKISNVMYSSRISAVESQRRGVGMHIPPDTWRIVDATTGQLRESTPEEERLAEAEWALGGAVGNCAKASKE